MTETAEMVDYDPYSPEAMVDPHRLYAALRADDPVHYMPRYDAWALAGFAGVWQACSDTASFSVRRGQIPNQVLLGEPAMNLTFPELDPPAHRHRRRVVAHAYTREAANADLEVIRSITNEVLTPLLERRSFDAFDEYASVVSARFAAGKAGVPAADVDMLRRLLHAAITREPGQRGTSVANADAMGQVFGYLAELIASCRANRRLAFGLLADLLDARVEGAGLDDMQIAAELHTLLVTGSETVELATAAALFHLDAHPDQQREVLADPTLAGALFAEAIRFDHPTDMLCRVVSQDVEVGGHTLRAGQGVLLLWASANRDEQEFERASEFDIHRRYERSLLFGHGQHKCIGEHVSMRMGSVLLSEMLTRIADYEIDQAGVRRRPGEFLKGFNAMPVRITPRSS
jgi:cytochrome P450